MSACSSARTGSTTVSSLPDTEVSSYNGQKLSPISDLLDVSISGPQKIDINTYKLKIDGLVETPTDFTYDQVLSNTKYSKVVTINCVEGWSAKILWEGILLKDLFDKVKVKDTANTVIFYCVDGFTTSLPLKTILDGSIMIAYKINGEILPAQDGYPFMLVAENKLGYKWAKWIVRIELSDKSGYTGYWESRGYSNDANVTN